MIWFHLDQFDNKNLHMTLREGANANDANYEKFRTWAQEFKERTWVKQGGMGGFKIPLNKNTLEHIESTWTKDQYSVSENAEFMLAFITITSKLDEKRSAKRWNYLFDNENTDYKGLATWELMPHQNVAVEAALNYPYFAYLMEMGTGKTLCAIAELNHYALRLEDGDTFRTLIVCPKSIRQNWVDELNKYLLKLIQYEIKIIDGQITGIEDLLLLIQCRSRFKIAIVSWDAVHRMTEQLALFMPRMIIMDESHYAKSPASKRYKAGVLLTQMPCTQMKRILTGTPVSNNLLDLWSQFELLQPGVLGYNTFAGYKREFCELKKIDNDGQDIDKIVGFKNVEALQENMARVSFIVKKSRCLKLPDRLYDTRRIEMPPAMAALYYQFRSQFTLMLEENVHIDADFIIVQLLKLSQICCGFGVAHDDNNEQRENKIMVIPGGDAKLNEMLDDLEDIVDTSKVIIWARFNYDIEQITTRIRSMFAKGGNGYTCGSFYGKTTDSDREKYKNAFNSDHKFRVLIANAKAGGTGVNLLGNQDIDNDRCKTAFFYSNDYNYGARDQAEARNHRIGQRNPVLYRDYVYEDTIEEVIAAALQSKRDLAESIKDVSKL